MHKTKNGVVGKGAACSGTRIKRLRRNMTYEEYREAIAKNLEHIHNDGDMEKLYEYSKLLVSNGGKKKLAIAMLLNEWVTEKTAGEIYYFLREYLYK